jgi:hypothetical protein
LKAQLLHFLFFYKEKRTMQDVQNIPNPDVNSTETNEDLGSHPEVERDTGTGEDVENPENIGTGNVEKPDESIPVPPDVQPQVPIEEPPDVNNPPVGEDEHEPRRIA